MQHSISSSYNKPDINFVEYILEIPPNYNEICVLFVNVAESA